MSAGDLVGRWRAVGFTLRVDKVWRLPGRPHPVVWGPLESGEVSVGDEVEVAALDGSVATGTVQWIELHGITEEAGIRRVGIVISGPATAALRHGAVVRERRSAASRGVIEWGGRRAGEATAAELAFATALNAFFPGLDYWLHADDVGSPWLLVSLDIVEDTAVRATARLDFDERGIRGGWSPACLNWDGELRAEAAGIDVSGPDGLVHPAQGTSVEDLARRAADWFAALKDGR